MQMDTSSNSSRRRSQAELVLQIFLAFVVIWFGINEIISPADWLVFAPAFLGTSGLALALVLAHGIILTLSGLLLVIGKFTRVVGIILSLMLIEIIVNLIISSGLTDIVVRDIGLLGLALAIALTRKSQV